MLHETGYECCMPLYLIPACKDAVCLPGTVLGCCVSVCFMIVHSDALLLHTVMACIHNRLEDDQDRGRTAQQVNTFLLQVYANS